MNVEVPIGWVIVMVIAAGVAWGAPGVFWTVAGLLSYMYVFLPIYMALTQKKK